MTRPAAPVDQYVEVQPLLRHVRIMERFFDAVDGDPLLKKNYDHLRAVYAKILAEELAPHAYTLALAVTQLEDAYPEIERGDVQK